MPYLSNLERAGLPAAVAGPYVWGDVGTISIDPKQSKVMGKWGAAVMPGSKEVLNWDTGKLEACSAESCPNAVDGVNHAPFAAFGGWGGGVNAKADPKVKDAAYAYFSFMTQPAQSNGDVTIGGTGFNPYRTSQLSYSDLWKQAGMSEDEAKVYLGAINDSMNSPNMILDLRIPQNQKYQQVVLDEAVSRFLSGEIDRDTAMQTIEQGWNDLNDEIGKDEQLKFYKATIGAPEARQIGTVVAVDEKTGKVKPIWGMGRHNHENSVAVPGYGKPVVLSGDDSFVSNPAQAQLYSYIAGSSDAVWNDEGDLWAFVADGVDDYYDFGISSGMSVTGKFVKVPKDIATGMAPEAKGRRRLRACSRSPGRSSTSFTR